MEQYVLAKYYMTTNVYRHRVRLITDQMIIRAIVLGIEEDGLDDLRESTRSTTRRSSSSNTRNGTDARLMFQFDNVRKAKYAGAGNSSIASNSAVAISEFTSSKCHGVRLRGQCPAPEDRARARERNPITKERSRQRIAEVLSAISGPAARSRRFEVIVHGFDTKSVRTHLTQ